MKLTLDEAQAIIGRARAHAGLLTAYGLGAYCANKHALEAIAATLRDELAGTDITVQTINPEPYDTGFNDRLADTTYRWHDDAINFTREDDIRASFRRS